MILKLRLLGCACICSSKILKPLGGKINLEEKNDILGSLFLDLCKMSPFAQSQGAFKKNANLSGTHLQT